MTKHIFTKGNVTTTVLDLTEGLGGRTPEEILRLTQDGTIREYRYIIGCIVISFLVKHQIEIGNIQCLYSIYTGKTQGCHGFSQLGWGIEPTTLAIANTKSDHFTEYRHS